MAENPKPIPARVRVCLGLAFAIAVAVGALAVSRAFFVEVPEVSVSATTQTPQTVDFTIDYSSDNCLAVALRFEYRTSPFDQTWKLATLAAPLTNPADVGDGCGTIAVTWEALADLGAGADLDSALFRVVASLQSNEGRIVVSETVSVQTQGPGDVANIQLHVADATGEHAMTPGVLTPVRTEYQSYRLTLDSAETTENTAFRLRFADSFGAPLPDEVMAPAGANEYTLPDYSALVESEVYDVSVVYPGADPAAEIVVPAGQVAYQPNARLVASSPQDGDTDVAVTRETILRFNRPLDPLTVDANSVYAEFSGTPIPLSRHLSPDNRTLTLFYDDPLPASSLVRVVMDGTLLRDSGGAFVDCDDDGFPGGEGDVRFSTLSLTVVPGTAVCGRVFGSEVVLLEDGVTLGNLPLVNARITVDGAEDTLFTYTDDMGNFRLEPAPAGRFFAHIDGRSVTRTLIGGLEVPTAWPSGPYYPFVGKPWDSVPGEEVTVGNIYLPLVREGTLQPVSETEDTTVGFASSIIAENAAEHPEYQDVSITVPAGSLYMVDGDGNVIRGGEVGISPVPPDRLPGQLPDWFQPAIVITVQTNGPGNFDTPAPVCFPNLPDPVTGIPAAPGEVLALASFNHDTGAWEIVGTSTVNAEGTLICSDPGSGILAPGWHANIRLSIRFGPIQIELLDIPNPCADIESYPFLVRFALRLICNNQDEPETRDVFLSEPSAPGAGSGSGSGPGLGSGAQPGRDEEPITDDGLDPGDQNQAGGPYSESELNDRAPRNIEARAITQVQDPVTISTGEFHHTEIDLQVPSTGMDFVWERQYLSKTGVNTPQGLGWNHSYNIYLQALPSFNGQAGPLIFHDGARHRDKFVSNGSPHLGQDNLVWSHPEHGHQITINGIDDSGIEYVLEFAGGARWYFYPFGWNAQYQNVPSGRLRRMEDIHGNVMDFEYELRPGAHNPNLKAWYLTEITDTNGRSYTLNYHASGYLHTLTDFSGRVVEYQYYGAAEADGPEGCLKSATLPAITGTIDDRSDITSIYTYHDGMVMDQGVSTPAPPLKGNLLTIEDAEGHVFLTNVYGGDWNDDLTYDKVVQQTWGTGASDDITFTYEEAGDYPYAGAVKMTEMIDRNGNRSQHYFNDTDDPDSIRRNQLVARRDYLTAAAIENDDAAPAGSYALTEFEYDDWGNISKRTNPDGSAVEYVYGGTATNPLTRHNLLRVVRKPRPGHGEADIVESFTYKAMNGSHPYLANLVETHTDPRGIVTRHLYDAKGNRTQSAIENENPDFGETGTGLDRWDWTYDSRGLVTTATHPPGPDGERRVDKYEYFPTGYLENLVVDFAESPAVGLNITTSFDYDSRGNLISETDPRGNTTTYSVDQHDVVYRIRGPEVTIDDDGTSRTGRHVTERFHDKNMNLERERSFFDVSGGSIAPLDGSLSQTEYEYDELNMPVGITRKRQVTSPSVQLVTESVTTYVLDDNRNVVEAIVRQGSSSGSVIGRTDYSYDSRDQVWKTVAGENTVAGTVPIVTKTWRNTMGNPVRTVVNPGAGAAEKETKVKYDGFQRPKKTTNGVGVVTTLAYDPSGNPVDARTEEPYDDPVEYRTLSHAATVYDYANRPFETRVDHILPPVNPLDDTTLDSVALTTTEYARNGLVKRTVDPLLKQTLREYDTADRLVAVQDHVGNRTEYELDANGNAVKTLAKEVPAGGGAAVLATTTEVVSFDDLDRPTGVRLRGSNDSILYTTSVAYGRTGDAVRTVDPRGIVSRTAYDAMGRQLSSTRDMDGDGIADETDPDDITTRSEYDASGRLLRKIDDNGNATTYVYDGLGRVVQTTFADGETTSVAFDARGNVATTTDQNGTVCTYTYDGEDRLIEKTAVPGTGVSGDTLGYTFEYDGLDRVVRAEDEDSLVERRWDSFGTRVHEKSTLEYGAGPASSQNYTITTTSNDVGRRTRLVHPSGRTFDYAFDDLHRLDTIVEGAAAIADYDYDGTLVKSLTLGNGTVQTNTFDVYRRLTGLLWEDSTGTDLSDWTFGLDSNGNKTDRSDAVTGVAMTMTYDPQNRMATWIDQDMVASSAPAKTYALDGAGNRGTAGYGLDDVPGSSMNEYASAPGSVTNTHDDNGNLVDIQPADIQIEYDIHNRMVGWTQGATVHTWQYDALGRRFAATIDGTIALFVHDGNTVIEERDVNGALSATYVSGQYADEHLLRTDETASPAATVWYLADDQFNVVALSDAAGAVVERYEYGDYGEPSVLDASDVVIASSAYDNPYMFTGRRWEPETGFYFYRARYYDPLAGRFVSRDPLGIWGDLLGLGNGYQYAGNNPWTYIDPTGLKTAKPGKEEAAIDLAKPEEDKSRLSQVAGSWAGRVAARTGGAQLLLFDKALNSPRGRTASFLARYAAIEAASSLKQAHAAVEGVAANMVFGPYYMLDGVSQEFNRGYVEVHVVGGGGIREMRPVQGGDIVTYGKLKVEDAGKRFQDGSWFDKGMMLGSAAMVVVTRKGKGSVRTGKGRDYVTYEGLKDGKPYVGSASAPKGVTSSPHQIIRYRYGGDFDDFGGTPPQPVPGTHGFGRAGKARARGTEQLIHQSNVAKYGRGNVANIRNPVGPNNPRLDEYMEAAGGTYVHK